MNQKDLSHLTDQQLLEESKKVKLSPTMNAVFIGFLIGVVIFSIAMSTWGLFTLIPLFFVYRLVQGSQRDKAVEEELKVRNLK